MTVHEIKQYADLVIKVGVNLYKGQKLNIKTGAGTYDFALVLAECAYENGAGYVEIETISNKLIKSRILHSSDEDLQYVPNYLGSKYNEFAAGNWANIAITNNEELDLLKDVNADKIGLLVKNLNIVRKNFVDGIMNDKSQWVVIDYPGPKWAAKVLGLPESEETTKKLWDKLKSILRLDTPDPVKAWNEHLKALDERKEILTKMQLDRLLFEGEGTELEIGLSSYSIWTGGVSLTPEGRVFLANIPTEEIFTSPDCRRTNGKVKVTKPVSVLENLVKDAWFEFKEGKVVAFGAAEGKEVLEQYFAIDEGASFLGEVALVDSDSPITQCGLLFNSILYDENASSHIALGKAYPTCYSNGNQLKTLEDKKAIGCCDSLVHTDFMIGSPELSVTGFDRNNKKIPVIKDGRFVI